MILALNLFVLRSKNPRWLMQFYNSIGFEFVEEKHGTGPLHYSVSLGGMTTMEIYPTKEPLAPVRIGFLVENVDDVYQQAIDNNAIPNLQPSQSEWGYRAIFRDPDMNTVELVAHKKIIPDDKVQFGWTDRSHRVGTAGGKPPQ